MSHLLPAEGAAALKLLGSITCIPCRAQPHALPLLCAQSAKTEAENILLEIPRNGILYFMPCLAPLLQPLVPKAAPLG